MTTIFDLEGPLVDIDHAFLSMSEYVPKGGKIFEIISEYDDKLFLDEQRDGYEAGNTLKLILPFLITHGVTNDDLKDLSNRAKYLRGAKETISNLREEENVYIISTSYEHLLKKISEDLELDERYIYSTKLDIEKYSIPEKDEKIVKDWSKKIVNYKEVNEEIKSELDKFFWEILPKTNFGKVIDEVDPIGGSRKYEALLDIISKENKDLSEIKVIGDSITDSVMLRKTKEKMGLSISFNGNKYAIESANFAIVSNKSSDILKILKEFDKYGINYLKQKYSNDIEKRIPYFKWIKKPENIVFFSEKTRRNLRGKAGDLG